MSNNNIDKVNNDNNDYMDVISVKNNNIFIGHGETEFLVKKPNRN